MTREEYKNRYIARLQEVAGISYEEGLAVYNAVDDDDIDLTDSSCPEDHADDEMSYWADDTDTSHDY